MPILLLLFVVFLAACRDKEGADSDSAPPEQADDSGLDEADDTAGEGCEVDRDADGSCAEDDCDDDNPGVYPGAAEGCDGVDEDCDGEIDEDAGVVYYLDEDGDGFGAESVVSCEPPAQYADNGADCDDTDPDIHPGAGERKNGQDDDCDGATDEDVSPIPAELLVEVTWSGRGVQVDILDGGAAEYLFGMAETGAGDVGWFGESCIDGDEPYGYPDYNYDICHTLPTAGGLIESVYPDLDLVEDGYTLFNRDIGEGGDLTYILLDPGGSDCWVFGDDPGYYAMFRCTEL